MLSKAAPTARETRKVELPESVEKYAVESDKETFFRGVPRPIAGLKLVEV